MVIKVPNQAEAIRFYNFPYEAIEEALVNAVYHKSYDVREPVEIRINYDSIQILSFERPLPPIKNENLTKERLVSRFYRNRRVGDFLKELEYTEGRSTGFPKIYCHLKRNYSHEPQFETDENNLHFFIHNLLSETLCLQTNRDWQVRKGKFLTFAASRNQAARY